jgi:hypothetical protein
MGRLPLSRRRFITLAGAGATGFAAPPLARAARGVRVVGAGRIGAHLPGITIASPSEFSFACDAEGGFFLCSMFGPDVGGWKGCQLMTLQGRVAAGTLAIRRDTATFSGEFSMFVFPDVFSDPPGPYLSAAAVLFDVNAVIGGPGKARMILHVPAVTETLGGDTGGVVELGRIERKRIRR